MASMLASRNERGLRSVDSGDGGVRITCYRIGNLAELCADHDWEHARGTVMHAVIAVRAKMQVSTPVVVLLAFLAVSGTTTSVRGMAADRPANTPRIHNPASPRDGHQVLLPREVWRRGGDDDDVVFGFVITAAMDEAGRVYLLDRWLGVVYVFGPDGELVGRISREGEGPGEIRQPTDLAWLPDGVLGIVQPSPARVVKIDREGRPQGDVVPAGVSARESQFGFLTEANWRGGQFVCSGTRTNFGDDGLERIHFLAVCDVITGAESVRVLEHRSLDDGRSEFREADHYWVHEGRWCLGPDGRIYTAPQRDAYAVHVYEPDGRCAGVISRDYEPWHRTDEERARLQARYTRPAHEWGGGRGVRISTDEPCLTELRVTDRGELWVRHGRSERDQARGVLTTWDVFASDGTYVRSVAIAVPGDPLQDRLLFLDEAHLMLIRGFYEASDAMWGPGGRGDGEGAVEVVYYETGESRSPTYVPEVK